MDHCFLFPHVPCLPWFPSSLLPAAAMADGDKLDTALPAAPAVVRRPVEPTVAGLLHALLTERTDPATWRALATVARMEQGDGADAYLAGLLGRALAHF